MHIYIVPLTINCMHNLKGKDFVWYIYHCIVILSKVLSYFFLNSILFLSVFLLLDFVWFDCVVCTVFERPPSRKLYIHFGEKFMWVAQCLKKILVKGRRTVILLSVTFSKNRCLNLDWQHICVSCKFTCGNPTISIQFLLCIRFLLPFEKEIAFVLLLWNA